MKTIRRIGIASAFKIGAILSALVWAVLGLFWLVLMNLVFSAMGSMSVQDTGDSFGLMAGFSIATSCIFYFVNIALNAIIGGIGGALFAALYNLVAGWVGGIEVELEDINY